MIEMGPGTGRGKTDGERIAGLEGRMEGLATAAQVAQLKTAIDGLTNANTSQHAEMTSRLFGQSPTSLQSQITAIHESAFSDNPMSLRSRIGTIEQQRAAISNRALGAWLAITGIIGFLGFKARDIGIWLARMLNYHP